MSASKKKQVEKVEKAGAALDKSTNTRPGTARTKEPAVKARAVQGGKASGTTDGAAKNSGALDRPAADVGDGARKSASGSEPAGASKGREVAQPPRGNPPPLPIPLATFTV